MGNDSDRCMGGAEITTYDSLDESLGQSRNNVYIGGKIISGYVLLSQIFGKLGLSNLKNEAMEMALLACKTISDALNEEGYIPAILEGDNKSIIIPTVEGLVYLDQNDCVPIMNQYEAFTTYTSAMTEHKKMFW